MSENFYLSPVIQRTLAVIKQQQAKYDAALEPVRKRQAEMQEILNQYESYFENIERLANLSAPAIEIANQYKALTESMAWAIPNFSDSSKGLLSEVEVNISGAISMYSFSDKISSFQIDNRYLNNEVQQSVSAEIISEVHEQYQKSSENEISNGNKTDEKDEIVKHNNLRSDLISKEWHAKIWIEAIYKYVVNALIVYSVGAISEIDLNDILKAINNFIDSIN